MFTAPAESSYRWRTPEQESARKSSSGYSIHCSLQNRAVWGWVCRSAVRSLRPMMAGCGLPRTNPRAPSFSLCCSPTVRRLLVLHDVTTSRLVRPSDTDEIDESVESSGLRRRRVGSGTDGIGYAATRPLLS